MIARAADAGHTGPRAGVLKGATRAFGGDTVA
jgi:hypothetical protein